MEDDHPSQQPTPRESEFARLGQLLSEGGADQKTIASVGSELASLATATPTEAMLANARALGARLAAAPKAPLGKSWIDGLASLLAQFGASGSQQPQPAHLAVRSTANADRVRVEQTVGATRILFECERCAAGKGWRVFGELSSDTALPADVSVVMTSADGTANEASLDDLGMFDMVVSAGVLSVALRADGQSLVLVDRLELM